MITDETTDTTDTVTLSLPSSGTDGYLLSLNCTDDSIPTRNNRRDPPNVVRWSLRHDAAVVLEGSAVSFQVAELTNPSDVPAAGAELWLVRADGTPLAVQKAPDPLPIYGALGNVSVVLSTTAPFAMNVTAAVQLHMPLGVGLAGGGQASAWTAGRVSVRAV